MIYFLLFVIVLIYIYEVWKSIKIQIGQYNIKGSKNKEHFNNSNKVKKFTPVYIKYGYIPHNVSDFSNNYIEPPIHKLKEITEEDVVEEEIVYPNNYQSLPYPNPDLDKPLTSKYYGIEYTPVDWRCQRDWMECNQSKYKDIYKLNITALKNINLNLK